ncbi:OsmC family protein [Luteimonas aquatica]|uniref:OsmC family protein n=1 Tax=Luteimonas aquatica TaxID=450364 RepID=UPI001F584F28|nr:OsmC family protein [Luteimonas aquatica]
MSQHLASIRWTREGKPFDYDSYSRDHDWQFDGGQRLRASAAPGYLGSAEGVDPEEALVAALSSCHMLTLLAIAAKKGLVIDRYEDDAVGTMGKNEDGRLAVTQVVLRPRIVFEGQAPDAAALARLHEQAHTHCFIANSVRTAVTVEPQDA